MFEVAELGNCLSKIKFKTRVPGLRAQLRAAEFPVLALFGVRRRWQRPNSQSTQRVD